MPGAWTAGSSTKSSEQLGLIWPRRWQWTPRKRRRRTREQAEIDKGVTEEAERDHQHLMRQQEDLPPGADYERDNPEDYWVDIEEERTQALRFPYSNLVDLCRAGVASKDHMV